MWTKHLVGALLGLLLVPFAPAAAAAAPDAGRFRDWSPRVDGSTYLAGRVSPDGARRWVYYQRRLCATCGWKPYARQLTDDAGRFRVRVEFPRTPRPTWAYRGYVPTTADQPRDGGRVWLACARTTC